MTSTRDPIEERIALMTAEHEAAVAGVRKRADVYRAVAPIYARHPEIGHASGVVVFGFGIVLYVNINAISDVTPLLRDIAAAGFRMHRREDKAAGEGGGLVEWHFDGDITVYAMISGAGCQFVQIGTKEVPVYEIRCPSALSEGVEAQS